MKTENGTFVSSLFHQTNTRIFYFFIFFRASVRTGCVRADASARPRRARGEGEGEGQEVRT
jgi:hypothetical protein